MGGVGDHLLADLSACYSDAGEGTKISPLSSSASHNDDDRNGRHVHHQLNCSIRCSWWSWDGSKVGHCCGPITYWWWQWSGHDDEDDEDNENGYMFLTVMPNLTRSWLEGLWPPVGPDGLKVSLTTVVGNQHDDGHDFHEDQDDHQCTAFSHHDKIPPWVICYCYCYCHCDQREGKVARRGEGGMVALACDARLPPAMTLLQRWLRMISSLLLTPGHSCSQLRNSSSHLQTHPDYFVTQHSSSPHQYLSPT